MNHCSNFVVLLIKLRLDLKSLCFVNEVFKVTVGDHLSHCFPSNFSLTLLSFTPVFQNIQYKTAIERTLGLVFLALHSCAFINKTEDIHTYKTMKNEKITQEVEERGKVF